MTVITFTPEKQGLISDWLKANCGGRKWHQVKAKIQDKAESYADAIIAKNNAIIAEREAAEAIRQERLAMPSERHYDGVTFVDTDEVKPPSLKALNDTAYKAMKSIWAMPYMKPAPYYNAMNTIMVCAFAYKKLGYKSKGVLLMECVLTMIESERPQPKEMIQHVKRAIDPDEKLLPKFTIEDGVDSNYMQYINNEMNDSEKKAFAFFCKKAKLKA